MNKIVNGTFITVILAILMVVETFVLRWMWAWFVFPAYGIPVPTLPQRISSEEDIYKSFFKIAVHLAISLSIALIIHLFVH